MVKIGRIGRGFPKFTEQQHIEEKNDLSASMPAKTKELRDKLEAYLKSVNAENVQTLRVFRRAQVVKNIPIQENKVKAIKKQLANSGKTASKELAHAENYLKFLKRQLVFIDERSLLHR